MNNAEIRIYGVECYFTQPNADKGDYSFKDYDNEEISHLPDNTFIESAENNGYVWTLSAFLREVEAHNFGAKSWVIKENMQFRAFLVPLDEDEPIRRIDLDDLKLDVLDLHY